MAKRTTRTDATDTVFEPPTQDTSKPPREDQIDAPWLGDDDDDEPIHEAPVPTLECLYCLCTEDDACETDDGPCSWISTDPPVCSAPECVKAHEARARDDDANPPIAEREDSPIGDDAPDDGYARTAIASGTSVAEHVPAAEPEASPPLSRVTPFDLEIPMRDIVPDPGQARDEGADDDLAPSIKANGVQQPVLVRPHPRAGENTWPENPKKHELQDAKERRTIHADAALKVVFGGKSKVSMFDLTKLVNKHLKPVTPA